MHWTTRASSERSCAESAKNSTKDAGGIHQPRLVFREPFLTSGSGNLLVMCRSSPTGKTGSVKAAPRLRLSLTHTPTCSTPGGTAGQLSHTG
ncbi:hypothetical protein Cadr_000007828 [Camelus dromedarius]|uniref:Uncharacterized protein n=1 Tax=Camelus dromedarius TaxID=9838 RepID=A0A5N4DZX9_CAMDR|nr:hypothetical protein Cadr_000007828 [Camelus dromedarius]